MSEVVLGGALSVLMASAPAGNVCPSRSGVRCVLSVCRPQVLVLDVLGLAAGAARVRAGRRDGANVACWGTSAPAGGDTLTVDPARLRAGAARGTVAVSSAEVGTP